jgi:cation:H+ antiporter
MLIITPQLLLCIGIIGFAGSKLTKYGESIAISTGLGKTWIGFILVATVTSIPELTTGIGSAALFNAPNITAGDILGSCMFNTFMFPMMALPFWLRTRKSLSQSTGSGHILIAAFLLLMLGIIGFSLIYSKLIPTLGWIGASSIVILIVYFLSMRFIYIREKRKTASDFLSAISIEDQLKLNRAHYYRFGINAVILAIAGVYFPYVATLIAGQTGLGQNFIGSTLVASSTSLPELVVSVTALRLGLLDLAYANILGSNLFDLVIFSIDDLVYLKGNIFLYISQRYLINIIVSIILTIIVIIGLATKPKSRNINRIPWDMICIALTYISSIFLLYYTK